MGVWSQHQSAFFASKYRDLDQKLLLEKFEVEKKRSYNDRNIQTQRGTFVPPVFTSWGAMGKETTKAIKNLAELLSIKRKQPYSITMGLLRCSLSFALLLSSMACLRGTRRR